MSRAVPVENGSPFSNLRNSVKGSPPSDFRTHTLDFFTPYLPFIKQKGVLLAKAKDCESNPARASTKSRNMKI